MSDKKENQIAVKEITKDEWKSLVDDIKSAWIENTFAIRMDLIMLYWGMGKRVRETLNESFTQEGHIRPLLVKLSTQTGVILQSLYQSVQFYDKFPTKESLNSLPHGKAISWNKIRSEILPDKKKETKTDKATDQKPCVMECRHMIDGKPACEYHPDLLREIVKEHKESKTEYPQYVSAFFTAYKEIFGIEYRTKSKDGKEKTFDGVDGKAIKDTMKKVSLDEYRKILAYLRERHKAGINKGADFDLHRILTVMTPLKIVSNLNFLLHKITVAVKKSDFEDRKVFDPENRGLI